MTLGTQQGERETVLKPLLACPCKSVEWRYDIYATFSGAVQLIMLSSVLNSRPRSYIRERFYFTCALLRHCQCLYKTNCLLALNRTYFARQFFCRSANSVQQRGLFRNYMCPSIGHMPVKKVTAGKIHKIQQRYSYNSADFFSVTNTQLS